MSYFTHQTPVFRYNLFWFSSQIQNFERGYGLSLEKHSNSGRNLEV